MTALIVLLVVGAALGFVTARRRVVAADVAAVLLYYVGLDSGWWGDGTGDGWWAVMGFATLVAAVVSYAAVVAGRARRD